MDKLPNELIIRIIREADGGLHTHKKKFQHPLNAIKEAKKIADEQVREMIEDYSPDGENVWGDNYDDNYHFWEFIL